MGVHPAVDQEMEGLGGVDGFDECVGDLDFLLSSGAQVEGHFFFLDGVGGSCGKH